MIPRASALLLLLLAAGPALASPPTALDLLLHEPRPAAVLRARLAEHARSLDGSDRYEAARARLMLGRSAARAGLADSAVAAFTRAADDRGAIEDVVALADALLARGGRGDVMEARARLERQLAGTEAPHERAALRGRLARALERLELGDSARIVWREVPAGAPLGSQARRRALALADSPDPADRAQARDALVRVALASRGEDAEALRALRGGGGAAGDDGRMRAAVAARARAGGPERVAALAAFGAHAVGVTTPDGLVLEAAVRAPAAAGRARAAVVLTAPDEPLAAADSLVGALARAGWATLVMRPRATGASVSSGWPGPWCIEERPEAWVAAAARDVAVALRELARVVPCDTTRVLLAASGSSVAVAARAAALDPRVAALALAGPSCEEAARAPLLDEVARRAPAVFVQMTPEDQLASWMLADALFHAGAAGHARLSEVVAPGSGYSSWRDDAAGLTRFTRWLAEPLPPARPAPRPAARRGG